MKRRQSARPVVVEVKRSRSLVPGSDNIIRSTTPGHGIWRNTAPKEGIAVADLQTTKASATQKAEPSAHPVRRILPNLMPMFRPNESQQEEPSEERMPRRARRATSAKMSPTSVPRLDTAPPAATVEFARSAEVLTSASSTAQHASEHTIDLPPSTRPLPSLEAGRKRRQSGQKLRRGEFWKRRLPSVCW